MIRMMRPLLVASMVLLSAGWPDLTTAAVAAGAAQDTPGPRSSGDKLPTVEWVLERYVTATGGREALLRHRSMTIHGRNYEPATKREVSGVLYTRDGKVLQVVTLP